MPKHASRMALIDALKGSAALLIVLHHLAFFGPMSDVALELTPDLIAWLFDYGRIAVQVFLVMAGFLAARALAPAGVLLAGPPMALIARRYFSLVLPFMVALAFAILGAAIARSLIEHDSIPGLPEIGQLIAHALLVQSIVGVDSLSAGVWYVAIDFQLFILMVAILALARHLGARLGYARELAWAMVAALGIVALVFFNREVDLDIWGIYFFGSYGLGVFAYWSSQQRHGVLWIGGIFAVACFALMLDFRLRIAVALAIALLLAVANRGVLMAWPQNRLLGWLGKISYSIFLIHFPVCMVVNAVIFRFAPESPAINLAGMGVAFLLSIAAGAVFFHYIENRVRKLQLSFALRRRWVFMLMTAGLGIGVALKPLL